MGNKRNFATHVSRGKFKKRKASTKSNTMLSKNPVPNNPVSPLNGSRIINLQNLQEHMQVITSHAASCQPCSDNLHNEQVTVTISEKT